MLIDEELELPYDVLLSKIDVKKRHYGLYNFYKMQVSDFCIQHYLYLSYNY